MASVPTPPFWALMSSAFPAFQGAEELLQSLLFKHLMPQSSAEIEQYLNDFSQQAKNLPAADGRITQQLRQALQPSERNVRTVPA